MVRLIIGTQLPGGVDTAIIGWFGKVGYLKREGEITWVGHFSGRVEVMKPRFLEE